MNNSQTITGTTILRGIPFARVNTFAAGWNDACTGALQYTSCTVIGQHAAREYCDGWKRAKRAGAGPELAFNQLANRNL